MNGSCKSFVLFLIISLVTTLRLPAPIIEEKPSPTKAPAKHEVETGNSKLTNTTVVLLRRFNGTWRRESSSQDQNGNTVKETRTLVIANGMKAEWTVEKVGVLSPGETWAGLSAPYNTIPEIHVRETDKSSDLKIQGSNLKIQWPPTKAIDWSPETIPAGTFKGYPYPTTQVYILDGDRLISTDGKSSATWSRLK